MVYSLSRIPFDIAFGSEGSVNLFNALIESPHREIFNSPAIQSLVR